MESAPLVANTDGGNGGVASSSRQFDTVLPPWRHAFKHDTEIPFLRSRKMRRISIGISRILRRHFELLWRRDVAFHSLKTRPSWPGGSYEYH